MSSIDQTVIQLISSVGFPIVAFFYICTRVEKKIDQIIALLESRKI